MKAIINPNVLNNICEIKQSFLTAEPFKHVVIDSFFCQDFCQKLLNQFPSFSDKKAINENGEVGLKAVNESVSKIGSAYKTLDKLVKSKSFISAIEEITGIKDLNYDPYYFGGGTHENKHGQSLDPHVDFTHHPLTGQHRRLNLIVYLNKEWEDAWGGNIEFHKNPRAEQNEDVIVSESPLFNKVVIFETNNLSWHGFPQINLPSEKQGMSRKSFALYYYTDTRTHQIKPHSTIYVERPLPEKFKAGLTLSDSDFQLLKGSITRRDQHLERLYNYISVLMNEVEELKWKNIESYYDFDAVDKGVGPNKINQNFSLDTKRLINRIHDMEHSTSWKITAPLRRFKKAWLRLKKK